MRTKDFYYHLPAELIAQTPIANRASSRLLMFHKNSGEIEHKNFYNIIDYLNPGDCLVMNDTRVIPARLYGRKESSGGKIEVLLLKRISSGESERGSIMDWEVILKPGRKARTGSRFVFGEGLLKSEVINVTDDGNRIMRFEYVGIFEEILDKLGEMPLPPYIKEKLDDKERYQTVYSKTEGSAAAPTAGLHFTEELLDEIHQKGIKTAFVTLHVGLGTFRPVSVDDVENHKMHSEYYEISSETANVINQTKASGGKIIAVGTTTVRTLESTADGNGNVKSGYGETDIFIYPGFEFKVIDGMVTNFHLPESTLLMLISAFATKENVFKAYENAIENNYRFFSFGDAMMIM